MDKKYEVEIPIIRKDFQKTKAAKFEAILKFISNEHGIILGWIIEFKKLVLDLCTTSSWILKNKPNFQRREKLFQKLNILQEKRPHKQAYNLYEVKPQEIPKVNKYFNEEYDSTLKNIIAIIKGSNPKGEPQKPRTAEIVIKNTEEKFVILFDCLTVKNYSINNKENPYYHYQDIGQKIDFETFFKLNDRLKSWFKFMQRSRNDKAKDYYKNEIKKYHKEFNGTYNDAEREARKARNKYGKNIDAKMKEERYPFQIKNKLEIQKCHIYEYHVLRDKIWSCLQNNKPEQLRKKYLNMIADPDNFLPLPEAIHRIFDHYSFTYNHKGQIKFLDEINVDEKKLLNQEANKKFHQIDKFFLTKERKEYLKKRNNYINNIYKQ